MLALLIFSAGLVATRVSAQSSSSSGGFFSASATTTLPDYATGNVSYNTNDTPSSLGTVFTYAENGTTRTRTESMVLTGVLTVGNTTITISSTPFSSTVLTGTVEATPTSPNVTVSGTATSTSTGSSPTNTVPCNGYPEFCNRQYSNITHVAAHNSPFVVANNVASNQALDVTYQLNDGIRMLQFQVHKANDTLYLCHTSCSLLNAGTLLKYLTTVREWIENNQYDVVTILMGNYDILDPSEFIPPIADSGLLDYVYTPPTAPMAIDRWPTLGEMILSNQRVVMMLDYEADQSRFPWLLDEFSYMWETPFSPTDPAFPCTADRPPSKDREVYEQRMSMANHNLNIDVSFAGFSILVPAYNLLNTTNADDGPGSAGWAVANCTRDWNRPPTFLLVDYYNIGNFNGSVFAVAAAANNVAYNRDSCCGVAASNAGVRGAPPYTWTLAMVAGVSLGFAAIM